MPAMLPNSSSCCTPECDDVATVAVPGPEGTDGEDGAAGADGVNAYSTTTASFVMPAEGATVSNVAVPSAWMAVGQKVYVNTAGYMQVAATPTPTTVNLLNPENTGTGLYSENVAPGTVIASGVKISPAGIQGPAGAGAAGQLLAANNLSDVASSATSRTNLGLAIGTNVQAYNALLAAIAALAANGIVVRTAAGTSSPRTITGTANRVTVTNGDGVAGNPTLTTPQDLHTAAVVTFGEVTTDEITGNPGIDFVVTAPSSFAGDVMSFLDGIKTTRVCGDYAVNAVLLAADTWAVFTNTGAAAAVELTLPPAAQGLQFTFIVTVNQTLTVRAAAGDTVRIAATVSGAGGGVETAVVGNAVTFVAVDSTNWVSIGDKGTWTFV